MIFRFPDWIGIVEDFHELARIRRPSNFTGEFERAVRALRPERLKRVREEIIDIPKMPAGNFFPHHAFEFRLVNFNGHDRLRTPN